MDFTVSVCVAVISVVDEVVNVHGNHGGFFFFNVKILDKALLKS